MKIGELREEFSNNADNRSGATRRLPSYGRDTEICNVGIAANILGRFIDVTCVLHKDTVNPMGGPMPGWERKGIAGE
jgi:hypothetical protein